MDEIKKYLLKWLIIKRFQIFSTFLSVKIAFWSYIVFMKMFSQQRFHVLLYLKFQSSLSICIPLFFLFLSFHFNLLLSLFLFNYECWMAVIRQLEKCFKSFQVRRICRYCREKNILRPTIRKKFEYRAKICPLRWNKLDWT